MSIRGDFEGLRALQRKMQSLASDETRRRLVSVIAAQPLADDQTRRPIVWHGLRHSGITWRAVRGDEHLKIQRAAGHTDLQ